MYIGVRSGDWSSLYGKVGSCTSSLEVKDLSECYDRREKYVVTEVTMQVRIVQYHDKTNCLINGL